MMRDLNVVIPKDKNLQPISIIAGVCQSNVKEVLDEIIPINVTNNGKVSTYDSHTEDIDNRLIKGTAIVQANNYIWNVNSLAWEKATGSLTEGQNVTVNNFPSSYNIRDFYTSGEYLNDQNGTGGVLTFNFSTIMDKVVILSAGGNARVDPFGGTPSQTSGIPCPDGRILELPVRTSSVKVYSPLLTTISVWGYKY